VSTFSREVRIGLTLVGAMLVVYLLIAWAQRIHFFAPEVNTYTVRFDNIAGLLDGDAVMVRGYQAGRVEQIRPLADRVEVTISVDKEVSLYQDAYAEVQVKEIMGGKHLSLMTGQQEPRLLSGGELSGRASLDISTSFSEVSELMRKADSEELEALWDRLLRMSVQLDQTMANIDPEAPGRILTQLESTTNKLNRALTPLKADRLDHSWQQLDSLMKQAQGSLGRIDALAIEAEEGLLPQADSLVRELRGTLHKVDQLVGEANELIEGIDTEESLVARLLTDPQLAADLDTTLLNLNRTLKQIQEHKIVVGFRVKDHEKYKPGQNE